MTAFWNGRSCPLLVEAHGQRLHRGGRLPIQQRRGLVLRADEVGGARIAGLEERPVGIELERDLEPGAVRDARGTDLIVEDHLLPATRFYALDVAAHRAAERQVLDAPIQPGRCVMRAEPAAQRLLGAGEFFRCLGHASGRRAFELERLLHPAVERLQSLAARLRSRHRHASGDLLRPERRSRHRRST